MSKIHLLYSWQIVTKQSRTLTLKLQNKHGHSGLKNLGTLTVYAEETVASRNAVEITFRCSHLENKDLFSLSVRILSSCAYQAICFILLLCFLVSYFSLILLIVRILS